MIRNLTCDWCKGAGYFPNGLTWVGSGVKKRTSCSVCDGYGFIPNLTEEDRYLVNSAAYAVVNAIAPDLPDFEKISNARWVEIVLDADHLESFGGHDKEEKRRLKQLSRGVPRSKKALIRRWVREAL